MLTNIDLVFVKCYTSLRGMVVIKGRRPALGLENEGYDTDDDSDDEGNTRSMSEESKVSAKVPAR